MQLKDSNTCENFKDKEIIFSYEDLKNCWDASSAYTMASHKDFKQTHQNFIEWIKKFKKNK